jgi:esterase/lipase
MFKFQMALICLYLLPSLFLSTTLHAQDLTSTQVSNVSFDADYFASSSTGKYGVIVVTGSDGGKSAYTAERIAAMGFHVLLLAYFDKNGSERVPDVLKMIKLEYFEAPKKWLMGLEGTRDDGVILYGLSKGAELALVLASYDNEYKGVVALAPSHVVWQAPREPAGEMSSSWSRRGKGLPFLPYMSQAQKEELGFTNLHEASLTNQTAVQNALIKVEDIQGPILLLSGKKDNAWPSAGMGEKVCATVKGTNPNSLCKHVIYEEGDHLLSNYQNESFGEVENFLNSLPE